jgi:hypothetical protein
MGSYGRYPGDFYRRSRILGALPRTHGRPLKTAGRTHAGLPFIDDLCWLGDWTHFQKHRDRPYRAGRSKPWVKVKNRNTFER